MASSTLQILHQSLNQLKSSKFMENDLFRELYDEAKVHEKNANLNKFVTGSNKNDKLAQETNFYLILTTMLSELRFCDQNGQDFNTNLQKIYKWYLNNRTSVKRKSEKKRIKSPTALGASTLLTNREIKEKPSFILATYIQATDRGESRNNNMRQATAASSPPVSSRQPRPQSPIYFPSMASVLKETTKRQVNVPTRPRSSIKLKNPLTETTSSIRPDGLQQQKISMTSLMTSQTEVINNSATQQHELNHNNQHEADNEQARKELMKAISSYASNFYTEINQKNTRKLKSNLKSLSKFYNTLAAGSNVSQMPTETVPITFQSLVGMAKDVSDQMVISKAKAANRIAEQRKLIQLFSGPRDLDDGVGMLDPEEQPKGEEFLGEKNSMSSLAAGYALTVVDRTQRGRPKSTSYLDWRGHTSRPTSTIGIRRKIKSEMRFTQPIQSCNTPRWSQVNENFAFAAAGTSAAARENLNEVVAVKNDENQNQALNEIKQKESSEQKSELIQMEIFDHSETATSRAKSSNSQQRRPHHPPRSGGHLRSARPSVVDTTKEVKFVSFVQKLEEQPAATKPVKTTEETKAAKITKIEREKPIESENVAGPVKTTTTTTSGGVETTRRANLERSANSERAVATVDELRNLDSSLLTIPDCLRDEIILCECCNYRSLSNLSIANPPNNSVNDIFHLTEPAQTAEPQRVVSNLARDESTLSQQHVPSTTPVEPPPPTRVNLKYLLLSNYDKNFAARIGIRDFIPTQILSARGGGENESDESDDEDDGPDLEFIPFEKIDSRYPRDRGVPTFDPNRDKKQHKLYRTNPSIPRPESKYGTRSNVYEQIIELKKQKMTDTKALVVWQPEDVHLVRDLLEIEHKPLTDALKIDRLQAATTSNETTSDHEQIAATTAANESRLHATNTKITPFGRPMNAHVQKRWKSLVPEPPSSELETTAPPPVSQLHFADTDYGYGNTEDTNDNEFGRQPLFPDIVSSSEAIKPRGPQFKVTGSSMLARSTEGYMLNQGRPIPTVQVVESPEKRDEEMRRYDEAKKMVHIPSIFKGSNFRNYSKEFNPQERLKREQKQLAALTIQRNYRRHLRDKRFIEDRPPLRAEMIEWARNFKKEMKKRREEKEKQLVNEKERERIEQEKFNRYVGRIGVHVDLYALLYRKGPEYTNRVLNRAATCIQRWVRGWLVRKEMDKVRALVESDGLKWNEFTKKYRRTVARVHKMRGGSKYHDFEFKPTEALEFHLREKKFSAYFDKLAFLNEIELSDIEKMFNFLDYYPSHDEINEAKTDVLKYYKRKANSTSINKRAMFDIIYYIYPPPATGLKSTRKSTWLSPIVDGEDALRLRGFKLVEPTSFDRVWSSAIKSRASTHIHKNTPEL